MTSDSLFDRLRVETTSRGVSRVRFEPSDTDTAKLAEVDAAAESDAPRGPVERAAFEQLDEYLAGRRLGFELPLDLESATPFRRRVLGELMKIPFGETVTYGELALRVGCGSARAIGQAVGRNPIPIIIPCHRVVARDGRLGGFTGGLERKIALLRLEGIRAERPAFASPISSAASHPKTPRPVFSNI